MPIHLFVPTYDIDECLAEIRDCLERGWTGAGPKSAAFEAAWRLYTGLPHAHFLNANTSGLHLALEVFKEIDRWGAGDEVISSPLTFVASNHAILHAGLEPVFADIDQYLCLDPEDVERKITPRTRAVMFVGIGGNTGQFSRVQTICRERGLRLILDAAHMAGSRLDGQTPSADANVYSFQAVKNLPTADAGMICFEDALADAMARKMSWMSISRDTYSRTQDAGSYRWLYDVEYVGHKYNGNDIMASIGLVQLRRLEADNAYRRQLSQWYAEALAEADQVGVIGTAPGCISSQHLFQVQVNNRDALMVELNAQEIYPGVHYRDNRDYRMYRRAIDDCPISSRMSGRLISTPLHIKLTHDDVLRVAEAVIAGAE